MDIFSIAVGAAGVGAAYFLYLAASKGLPAAWAWLKAKWTAGTAELAALKADVLGANARVDALAKGAVAELTTGLAAVKTDVEALKAKVATPIGSANSPAAPPAPAFIAEAKPPA